jgi:hypothetical protein
MKNIILAFKSLSAEERKGTIIAFMLSHVLVSIFVILTLFPAISISNLLSENSYELTFHDIAMTLIAVNILSSVFLIIEMVDNYHIKMEVLRYQAQKDEKEYADEKIQDIEARNEKTVAINKEKRQIAKRLENLNK